MSGVAALARHRFGWFPTVLTYHGVHDGTLPCDIYEYNTKHLAPDLFWRQLVWVRQHFKVVPLADVERAVRTGRWEPQLAAITFDDGYENNLRVAAPILAELGLPWTMFVTVDVVEHGRPYDHDRIELALRLGSPREVVFEHDGARRAWSLATVADRARAVYQIKAWLSKLDGAAARVQRERLFEQCWQERFLDEQATAYRPLTWAQVRELADAGVEIGSHTLSHPHLSRISDDAIRRELAESRRILETKIGRPVTRIGYPYGNYDERVMRIAEEVGYGSAYTINPWFDDSPKQAYAVPRINIPAGQTLGVFKAIASRSLLMIRRPQRNGTNGTD